MGNKLALFHITLLVFLAMTVAGHSSPASQKSSPGHDAAKIKFRLADIHPNGLRGLPDSMGSVAYEFCVPANDRVYKEVRRIDPSVQIMPGSHGRVGCTKSQTLCVGKTSQPHWRDVLNALSALPYVTEIRECFFE